MSWPSEFPPVSRSFHFTQYPVVSALTEAIRERYAALGMDTAWPYGSNPWAQGSTFSRAVDDSGGAASGKLRFYDLSIVDPPGWVDGSSIKRWVGFGGTFDGHDLSANHPPASYQLVIYPKDSGSPPATRLGDASKGFTKPITDCGDDGTYGSWVEIADDGELFLNGKTIADYGSGAYAYKIIRAGSGTRRGDGWVDRYPPKPNDAELHWGLVTAATTTSISDTRDGADDRWRVPWDLGQYSGKEVIFQDGGGYWRRKRITLASAPLGETIARTIYFDALPGGAAAPNVGDGFWIVNPGAYWRPRARLSLLRREGRNGKFWKRDDAYEPWQAGGLWNGTASGSYVSHLAYDDTLAGCPIPLESIHLDDGSPEGLDVHTFDQDARTGIDVENGQDDHLFNPRMFQSVRDEQVAIEDLHAAGPWVEPKSYEGAIAIPDWPKAAWARHWVPANTRTVVIDSLVDKDLTYYNSATVSFSGAITLPNVTPAQGAYTELPATFVLYDAQGEATWSGHGTVTSTTFTWQESKFFDNPPPPTSDGNTQVGLTMVIAFAGDIAAAPDRPDDGPWTRHFARLVKLLYARTSWIPDDNEDLAPSEDFPGQFLKRSPSTNYAQYTKYGVLDETGHAFLSGELAVYVADNFEDPTTDATDLADPLLPFYDAYYQGTPNTPHVSSWPRWEGGDRKGVIKSAGPGFIGDDGQLWWLSAGPSATISGIATGGGVDTLQDSGASGSGWWLAPSGAGTYFVGLILEVEIVSGSGVWEPRPITAQSMAGTPTLSVPSSTPFTTATSGKNYRIRLPGAGGSGAIIANLWETRQVKVTKADGSRSAIATINYSDDTRLFLQPTGAAALPFAPAVGDRYEILQYDPGQVYRYAPEDDAATPSGWVGPLPKGTKPTLVTNFGRYRKRDYIGIHVENEMYLAIDCLRWIKITNDWSANGEDNFKAASFEGGNSNETSWDTNWGYLLGDWSGANSPPIDPNYLLTSADDVPPGGEGDGVVDIEPATAGSGMQNVYAYATVSGLTTTLNSEVEVLIFTTFPHDPDPVPPDTNDDISFFTDYGLGYEENVFNSVYTFPPTADATRISSTAIGDTTHDTVTDIPAYPGDPIDYGFDHDIASAKGWRTTKWQSIEKFDVSGGLTYVTPRA